MRDQTRLDAAPQPCGMRGSTGMGAEHCSVGRRQQFGKIQLRRITLALFKHAIQAHRIEQVAKTDIDAGRRGGLKAE